MTAAQETLAINGGEKLRKDPFPGRGIIGPEEKAAVDALFDEAIRTGNAPGYGGETEEAYCNEFAASLGGGFADAVNSGTTAVFVALKALGLPAYSEVIVGAITDAGGMMPVPLLNCIPVVADVAEGSFCTGPAQVEPLITERTSAILVAHIMGEPADMDGIMALAKKHNLRVVEDCAQAHGAKLNGQPLGTFGDAAAFSTMFGKHHCTGGQGGVVFTKDEKLYQRIRRASDRGKPFGLPDGSSNAVASLNCNLSDLAAAIGREQLRKLPGFVRTKRGIVDRLAAEFADLSTVALPALLPGAEASYWRLRIRFQPGAASCDKDAYVAALGAEGLRLGGGYALNMPHRSDWFRKKEVFGTPGLPWTSPEYKGDPDREFPCPNADALNETDFILFFDESWGEEEIRDAAAIFRKVDAAYRK